MYVHIPDTATVGENIIATIKMQNNICYPLKMAVLDFSLLLPIWLSLFASIFV